MKEYTLLQRVGMIFRVLGSTVSWVTRILVKIVRNLLPFGSKSADGNAQLQK